MNGNNAQPLRPATVPVTPPTPAPTAPAAEPGGVTAAPPPVDLNQLLLPADWTKEQLEAEARRIYFEDLLPNPPQTPLFTWLDNLALIIRETEGAFQKIFGKTVDWSGYAHHKTGELDLERLRRAPWIRPVLEMRVKKTQIYVNNHSMAAREHTGGPSKEKKRLFITTGGLLYFISLVYIDGGLALSTAFPPDGQWLREVLNKHGTTRLGP